MAVTNVFGVRPLPFTVKLFVRLAESVPGFVAIKNDVVGELVRQLCVHLGERVAVFAGGAKFNHFDIVPYGGVGYLSTFITFLPHVTQTYWQAMQRGDTPAALDIIRRIDIPFFDYIRTVQGSYDAAIHGTMELFGVAKRWRRKPYYSLNDREMDDLRDFYARLGLI